MRIKDFIEKLEQFDPETEVVINVDGDFISPKMKKDIVMFKHNYSGVSFKDDCVVLSK